MLGSCTSWHVGRVRETQQAVVVPAIPGHEHHRVCAEVFEPVPTQISGTGTRFPLGLLHRCMTIPFFSCRREGYIPSNYVTETSNSLEIFE